MEIVFRVDRSCVQRLQWLDLHIGIDRQAGARLRHIAADRTGISGTSSRPRRRTASWSSSKCPTAGNRSLTRIRFGLEILVRPSPRRPRRNAAPCDGASGCRSAFAICRMPAAPDRCDRARARSCRAWQPTDSASPVVLPLPRSCHVLLAEARQHERDQVIDDGGADAHDRRLRDEPFGSSRQSPVDRSRQK